MFKYNKEYDCYDLQNREFYSCPWIQHGLVFFFKKLTNCCYCGYSGNSHPILKDIYRGEPINWEHLFRQKNYYFNLAKKGFIHENCMNCHFLEKRNEKEWITAEQYIDNLYISHWIHCNCRCTYCYATQKPEEFKDFAPYSILYLIREMLEKNILRSGGSVHFGGGEPTLLGEFEDIINLLLDYKFYNLRVHTSGIKYSKALERGIREGRLRVVISADAGTPETYRKIKQVPLYHMVRENAKRYAAAQIKTIHRPAENFAFDGSISVATKFIIIPGVNDTEEEVKNWIKADIDAGINTTMIDVEENWFKEHENNLPQSIFDFIYKIKILSEKYGTNFELYERAANMIKAHKDKAPWYSEEEI